MNHSDTDSEEAYFSCDDEVQIGSTYFMEEGNSFFDSNLRLTPVSNGEEDHYVDCPSFQEAFPLVLSSRNSTADSKSNMLFKSSFSLLFSSLPNLESTGKELVESSFKRIKSLPSLGFFKNEEPIGDSLLNELKISEYSLSEDKCSDAVPAELTRICSINSFKEDFDSDNEDTGTISSALQVSEYSLKHCRKSLEKIPDKLQFLFANDSLKKDEKDIKKKKTKTVEENSTSQQKLAIDPDKNDHSASTTTSETSENDGVVVSSLPPMFSCIIESHKVSEPIAWNIDFSDQKPKVIELPSHLQQRFCLKCESKEKPPILDSFLPEVLDFDLKIPSFKVLDIRRWFCMSRPQYSKSCGITSLVSVWNYLYSTIGSGNRNPITQEEALNVLGYKPPFGEIKFGAFTGNATLMRWFSRLNAHYGVKGKSCYMYKPKGRCATKWVTNDSALNSLKQGLAGDETAFIYHCLNHYFCPIGYEDTPQDPTRAYLGPAPDFGLSSSDVDDEKTEETKSSASFKPVETWIFIGEPSRKHPPIHCKRWTDILQDLHMESPFFYDIRRQEKGVYKKNTKKKGNNLHCIIAFHKA